MENWPWYVAAGCLGGAAIVALAWAVVIAAVRVYFRHYYGEQIIRIFEERPLFIVPRGQISAGAEQFRFEAPGGVELQGCYFRTVGRRKGVILFGLEFGSNRWSAAQYCAPLLAAGYDIFTYEPRNQADSDKDSTYEPIQWVTDRDLGDLRAALRYLMSRDDAPSEEVGIGVFGISKGGSVALLEAAENPLIRCIATDGAYAAYTTMVPYMRRWVSIYSERKRLQQRMPDWLYGQIGLSCMRVSARRRGVRFLNLEPLLPRLRQPLLMIHGGADTYIKPVMAETLYKLAGSQTKDLWIVPGAKHNQAAHIAGVEYSSRLVAFFDEHLAPENAYATSAGDSLLATV